MASMMPVVSPTSREYLSCRLIDARSSAVTACLMRHVQCDFVISTPLLLTMIQLYPKEERICTVAQVVDLVKQSSFCFFTSVEEAHDAALDDETPLSGILRVEGAGATDVFFGQLN